MLAGIARTPCRKDNHLNLLMSKAADTWLASFCKRKV